MSPIIIAIIIVLPTLAVLVLAFWFIFHFVNRRYENFINGNSNSVRTVIIDYNRRTVRFFNRNSIRKIRNVTLDQFYYQYSKADANRMDAWLNETAKRYSKADDTFEIEVRLHKSRRRLYSLLRVTNVDKDKKIIYLDSYLFPNLSARSRMTYYLRNRSIDDKIIQLKILPGTRGFTVNFRFSSVSESGTKESVSRLLYTQLKEIAAGHAVPPQRHIIDTGNHEFTIIDFRTSDYSESLNFVHTIVNEMRSFLEVNAKSYSTNISVGVVHNAYFPGDTKKLIAKAQEMSKTAYEKSVLIVTYNKNTLDQNSEDKFDSEINQIIRNKQITYLFTPIYDVKHAKIIGYVTEPKPNHTSAKTIEELYTRSIKTGENKQLIQTVIKDSLSIFSEQSKDDRLILFRMMKFGDANTILNYSRSNVAKETRSGICFDEFDISYYTGKNKDFFDIVEKYKARRIYLCLSLSDKTLILDHKIYSVFDYFFVQAPASKAKKTDTINITTRTIVEKLIKYGKPIILNNVEGWSNVELFVRSGVEYIMSNTIAPTGEFLSVPAPKTITKINRMLK